MKSAKTVSRSRWLLRLALIGLAAGSILSNATSGTRPTDVRRPVVFKDVSVFDGQKIIPRCNVVIDGPKIVSVRRGRSLPSGAEVIDGKGLTLLPGLIDSHVHAFSAGELRRCLMFGVTTVMDMMSTPVFMKAIKAKQAGTGTPDMADMFSAGLAATAPGGHGTEYGGLVPTLTKPEEAAAFVSRRKAEGSDYIKIMSGYAKKLLAPEVIAAVAAEARKQGLLSVVHCDSQPYVRQAIEAGVNGLAHCFADAPPERDLIDLMRAKRAFVIPTLTVMTNLPDAKRADLIHDPRLAPYLSPDLLVALDGETEKMESGRLTFAAAEETARRLYRAGIPVLVGTDSTNPGTAHGLSIHGELELLVGAGMTPADALAGATSVPAAIFGLEDRGRIAPGLRADLLLVRGDPTQDIKVTRDIVGVWKLGRRLDRDSYRTAMEALQGSWKETGKIPAPFGSESGLISDFDSGDTLTNFGFSWFETTDAMMGGKSTVVIGPAAGGAEGTAGSMSLSGQMNPGGPFLWAGAMFYPGITYWTCPNLSAWNAVSFWAKGDPGKAVVMLVLQGQQMPATQFFEVGREWKKYEFPFSSLGKTDGTNIVGLAIGAAQAPGPFEIQIDQVRLEAAAVEKMVKVGPVDLFFRIFKGGSPTVLLESGGGMDSGEWTTLASRLAEATGATVVTYDRAGFGRSDLPGTPYDLAQETGWLWAALGELGLDKDLVLAGHSYGGFLLRHEAATHPKAVRGLVFIDPFTVELVALLGIDYCNNREGLGKLPKLSPEQFEKLGKQDKADLRMGGYPNGNLGAKCDLLRPLTVPGGIPIRVLTSGRAWLPENEMKIWRQAHDLFTASMPGAKLVVVDSDHMIPERQPDLVLQALAEVIAQAKAK